jgi:hypothetical protein
MGKKKPGQTRVGAGAVHIRNISDAKMQSSLPDVQLVGQFRLVPKDGKSP